MDGSWAVPVGLFGSGERGPYSRWLMGAIGNAYAGVRERMTALAVQGDPAAIVPACPNWSIRMLLAHVTGVVDDALAGRLEGAATDPWTAAQVASRRATSVEEILAEWTAKAPAFEHLLDNIGSAGHQAVFDVTTHEHDLRGALGRPGAHDSHAVQISLAWLAPKALEAFASASLPPIRILTTEGDEWTDTQCAATLKGPRFEVLRALSGRRSRAQIRALPWDGDADIYLPAFESGPFRIPVQDIND